MQADSEAVRTPSFIDTTVRTLKSRNVDLFAACLLPVWFCSKFCVLGSC